MGARVLSILRLMSYSAQEKYIHKDRVRRLQEQIGGTSQGALDSLRKLLRVSSSFPYGVRWASFTNEDLEQAHLRAKYMVSIPGKISSRERAPLALYISGAGGSILNA